MGNGPEEEEDGQAAAQGAHAVYGAGGGMRVVPEKDDEEAAHEDEERGAGRVGDLESIATGDEFPAIPEAAGGFHGEDEYGAGNKADDPAGDAIQAEEIAAGDRTLHMNVLC